MAHKLRTLFVDDIDGSEAEGTVRFGLDGAAYEIDLSQAHREELRRTLASYVAHARKISTRRPRGHRNSSAVDTHKIRAWAKEQGIEIKERGRVPAGIVDKYRKAAAQ